jgi:hypothetical protein
MLRVMAYACQFTVAHTLGHNCSYHCDEAQSGIEKDCGTGDRSQPGIEADSRKTIVSQVQRAGTSVVQRRMGCV